MKVQEKQLKEKVVSVVCIKEEWTEGGKIKKGLDAAIVYEFYN